MTKYIFNIILLSMILSSCSNFLTWHLDKGIHKNTSQNPILLLNRITSKRVTMFHLQRYGQPQQIKGFMVIQDI